MSFSDHDLKAVRQALPLLSPTPEGWARLAAADLPRFLADHAVCEQQAALSALQLVGQYPGDEALVEKMTSLAVEEVIHLKRVATLLRRRGLEPARRRANPYVTALQARVSREGEGTLKLDRLLVGALIEARSCERFSCLLDELGGDDPDVAALLNDLGPAERRHWEMFYGLARRDIDPDAFAKRWRGWLEFERDLTESLGRSPTVHG